MNNTRRDGFSRMVWALALPILINALIDSAVDMADTFMLGCVSQDALSASALANNLLFLAGNFFFGLCAGAGILIAQYWGKKDPLSIRKSYGIALRMALSVGFLFSAVSILFPGTLMRLFTDNASLIGIGSGYLRLVGICNLINAFSRVYIAAQRSMERAVIGTVANTAALLINTFLNACFIFGLGPFPALGITGVAIATVAARIVELLICVWDATRPERKVRLGLTELFLRDKALLSDFVRYTLPALGNDLAWSLGITVFSVVLGHMGSAVVAANAYATTFRNLSAIPVSAVCNAAAVIVGKKLGENALDTARLYGKRFIRLSMLFGLLSAVLLIPAALFAERLPGVEQATAVYLRFMLFFSMPIVFTQAINRMTLDALLRSGGDTMFGLWLELIFMWGVCALGGCLLAFVLHANAYIVYMWLFMDEIVKAPWTLLRYRRGKWVVNLTRDNI